MAGRASAFAILGLAPGADAAAVEEAYKRLIKRHHPDREGGDGVRAAEIIRAYRELRGGPLALPDPLDLSPDLALERRRPRWPIVALLAVFAFGAIALLGRELLFGAATPARTGPVIASVPSSEAMDQPLDLPSIDAALREAVHLARTSDEFAMAEASRDCQRRFRAEPTIARLDRCAAFDDAVVQLQDRDPLRDRGPFGQVAVTGREWSAGSALSDDYLAIDGRFDRIRLQVELALAPLTDPQPAPANGLAVGGGQP